MGFVVYRSFHLQGVRCEVCITYHGLSQCRTVEGERQEDVLQAAVNNVCAYLANGVTDGMACMRTPPTKSECRGHRLRLRATAQVPTAHTSTGSAMPLSGTGPNGRSGKPWSARERLRACSR